MRRAPSCHSVSTVIAATSKRRLQSVLTVGRLEAAQALPTEISTPEYGLSSQAMEFWSRALAAITRSAAARVPPTGGRELSRYPATTACHCSKLPTARRLTAARALPIEVSTPEYGQSSQAMALSSRAISATNQFAAVRAPPTGGSEESLSGSPATIACPCSRLPTARRLTAARAFPTEVSTPEYCQSSPAMALSSRAFPATNRFATAPVPPTGGSAADLSRSPATIACHCSKCAFQG